MSFRYSSCFSFNSPNIRSTSTSENPMMAFSGVRSSWDMFARNSDLCWLAAASCRPFASISRKSLAFWMASADWGRLAPVGVERRARRELFRVLVVLEDRGPVRARELDGPADDRGEDGVEIEGGADRPPDVPEGRELLDRAGELLRPRLQRAQ